MTFLFCCDIYLIEKDRLADEQDLRDELRKNMQAIFPATTQSSIVDEGKDDVEEDINPYNISRFLDEVKRVHGLNISDVNKHQYISCLMGRSGPLTGVIGLLGGVAWEGADHFRPEIVKSYGGRWNLLNNNIQDMGNNLRGAIYGIMSNENCSNLLK